MKDKRIIFILFCCFIIAIISVILYHFNIIPHKSYQNEDFNIKTYISNIDRDKDGIDDQTDILNNARDYILKKPKYQSKYYETGYPNDENGVCTDVIGYALFHSGYNLMNLVNKDIKQNPNVYNIETIDINIDFRRVRNLNIYFKRTAKSLTLNLNKIEEWQGGDIVVFKTHIGIVSDKRNKHGIPFLIHHAYNRQFRYEEDILERRNDFIGHYRIS